METPQLLPNTQDVRHCTCPDHVGGVTLPATTEFFAKRPNGEVDSWCRVCMKSKRRERNNRLRDAGRELLAINAVKYKSTKRVPHIRELLERTYRGLGGFHKLSKLLVEFLDKPAADLSRIDLARHEARRERVALALMKATQELTEHEENKVEYSNRTTAELRMQFSQLLMMAGVEKEDIAALVDEAIANKPQALIENVETQQAGEPA